MSDKIEYSRLLLKRSGIPGEVPTFTTGTTLNEMIPTDLFVGEMYLNTADDLMWVRTDNGILPIALSGMTGTTIPTLLEVLGTGNITGGFNIYVSTGTTIQYEGLNSGSTTTILGLDASGNTITTSVAGATQDLNSVLSYGNITDGYNIIVSTGDTISSPNGENEIFLQSSGNMGLQSVYTLGGNNITEQIKMRAASGSDAGIEIQSYDSTNLLLTKSEYRPSSIKDLSFDSGGSFVETRLESSGFTIDLTNTSAGYLTIDGLLPGTATDLLGIDSNNRVVPYTIPLDIYSTGGTYSNGTLTINRNDGNSFNISGLFTGYTSVVESLTTGTGLSGNTTTGNVTITNTIRNGSFGITIDGGGSAITTGVKGYITIPYDCTITGWDIFSDVSGSIVVDVWKDTYANFPPTVADTIAGSEKPTLSSAVKNQDNDLTTWTTSVSSGDIIAFNVDSASTLTRVNLIIKVLKTS